MKQPNPLQFVVRESPRFRFRLRTLLLFMACVGPVVLVTSALPKDFYILQGILILAVTLAMGLTWCASFVRPKPLAFCFAALLLISAVLGTSLFVGRAVRYEVLGAATGVSLLATLVTGLALGLSWSRYAN